VSDEPVFHRGGGLLIPTGHARGPWHAEQLHGGAPAALLAGALQDLAPEMQVARLGYDFLGPVPLAPLRVEVRIAKPGRRFQLAEGELQAQDGRTLVAVRAALLRRGEVELPESSFFAAPPPAGGPGDSEPAEFPVPPGDDPRAFQRTAMEIRFAGGGSFGQGPAHAWFRLARPLVAGEEPHPVARAAAAADFGNGISRVLDFRTHLFTNVDLTVTLLRDPASEWVTPARWPRRPGSGGRRPRSMTSAGRSAPDSRRCSWTAADRCVRQPVADAVPVPARHLPVRRRQALRRDHRGGRPRPRGARGRLRRPARSERGGQVHHDEAPHRPGRRRRGPA